MKKILLLGALTILQLTVVSQISSQFISSSNSAKEASSIYVERIATGTNKSNLTCSGNALNDDFVNAQVLVVNSGTVSGTTCGTLESGENMSCNPTASTSVWYKFTATSTNHFVQIKLVSGSCYFGSAVYSATALPTNTCSSNAPISCQSISGGPLDHLYQLTNLTIGTIYHVQVLYNNGGICGPNVSFNIQVTTTNPGGNITNPPPISTCVSPQPGCYFASPPSVPTVTATCNSYSLAASGYSANSVVDISQTFTNGISSTSSTFGVIISSNCGLGNTVWLFWKLYDCSCNLITCGNLNNLTATGLTPGACYIIEYQLELENCTSFTSCWPYQTAGSSIGILEIENKKTNILLYPNPTTNQLKVKIGNIERSGDEWIEIKNSEGKIIYSVQLKGNEAQIDCSAFAKGNYLVSVFTNKKVIANQKLIIQ